MASEDIENVRAFLASFPDRVEMPVDEMRQLIDQGASYFPLPEGTSVEEVDSDGVPGE